MKPLVSVGARYYIDVLREKLEYLITQIRARQIPLDFWEKQAGEYTFWGCYIQEKTRDHEDSSCQKSLKKFIKSRMADIITNLIIDEWEKQLIIKNIKNNYCFNKQEQEVICSETRHYLEAARLKNVKASCCWENIRNTVVTFFEESDLLVICKLLE